MYRKLFSIDPRETYRTEKSLEECNGWGKHVGALTPCIIIFKMYHNIRNLCYFIPAKKQVFKEEKRPRKGKT